MVHKLISMDHRKKQLFILAEYEVVAGRAASNWPDIFVSPILIYNSDAGSRIKRAQPGIHNLIYSHSNRFARTNKFTWHFSVFVLNVILFPFEHFVSYVHVTVGVIWSGHTHFLHFSLFYICFFFLSLSLRFLRPPRVAVHRAIHRAPHATVHRKRNVLHAEVDALHSKENVWITVQTAITEIKSVKNACHARPDARHARPTDFAWHARRTGSKIRKIDAYWTEAIIVMNVSALIFPVYQFYSFPPVLAACP